MNKKMQPLPKNGKFIVIDVCANKNFTVVGWDVSWGFGKFWFVSFEKSEQDILHDLYEIIIT